MAYTEGVVNIKDAAGTSTPVDAALVANTSTTEPVASTTAARQIFSVGDPSTAANVQTVDANMSAQITVGRWQNTETTTILAANAVFTGSTHDSTILGEKIVTAFASNSTPLASSSSNGFTMQVSGDGVEWTPCKVSVTAGGGGLGSYIQNEVSARYWRIVYTNGSTAQTGTFVLTTDCSSIPSIPLVGATTLPITNAWVPVVLGSGTNSIGTVTLNSGSNTVGTVNPPSITKGTQGSTGFTVQPLKDAGRTLVYMGATQVTGSTSETVITCNITKGTAAQTAAPTYTVSAGKTLNIQSLRYGVSATVGVCTIRLRLASVTGAPIWEDSLNFGSTTGNQASETQSFPDGLQLPAGTIINWTNVAVSGQKVDVALVGYEY